MARRENPSKGCPLFDDEGFDYNPAQAFGEKDSSYYFRFRICEQPNMSKRKNQMNLRIFVMIPFYYKLPQIAFNNPCGGQGK